MVRLKKIDREGNKEGDRITFYYDDGEVQEYKIDGHRSWTYLCKKKKSCAEHNRDFATKLGIDDIEKVYQQLGIFTGGGDCPYCNERDIPTILDYLEKNFCNKPIEEPIKEEKPKEQSEYSWLFN